MNKNAAKLEKVKNNVEKKNTRYDVTKSVPKKEVDFMLRTKDNTYIEQLGLTIRKFFINNVTREVTAMVPVKEIMEAIKRVNEGSSLFKAEDNTPLIQRAEAIINDPEASAQDKAAAKATLKAIAGI